MAMVQFTVIPDRISAGVQLLYLRDEHSFHCEPRPSTRGVSVTVNELQLWFNDDGQVLYVDGYCPHQVWQNTSLRVPKRVSAGLIVVNPDPKSIRSGIAVGLNDLSTRWPVHVNPEGWVCIGDPADQGEQVVEFVPNCVAVLKGNSLIALWLQPLTRGKASDAGQ